MYFEHRNAAEPGPERAQDERLIVLPFDAEAEEEEHVGALRFDGQADFGLDFEVWRGAALDQVDEGQVPEVEGEIHGSEIN